jgi:hypothetical protein
MKLSRPIHLITFACSILALAIFIAPGAIGAPPQYPGEPLRAPKVPTTEFRLWPFYPMGCGFMLATVLPGPSPPPRSTR